MVVSCHHLTSVCCQSFSFNPHIQQYHTEVSEAEMISQLNQSTENLSTIFSDLLPACFYTILNLNLKKNLFSSILKSK